MKPIEFKEQNCTFAENQEEYGNLPAFNDGAGSVISCWGVTVWERLMILLFGKIYLHVSTFNKPLQPVYIETNLYGVSWLQFHIGNWKLFRLAKKVRESRNQ